MIDYVAYAPLLALSGAIINGLFGRALKEPLPGIIGSLTIGAGFLLSLFAFFSLRGLDEPSVHIPLWQYITAGNFNLALGFHIDSFKHYHDADYYGRRFFNPPIFDCLYAR